MTNELSQMEAHQSQMNQILTNKDAAAGFSRVVFDMLRCRGSEQGALDSYSDALVMNGVPQ